MITVFIRGFREPFPIVGSFLKEDGSYLYLINLDGISTKILRSNILYIEEEGAPVPTLEQEPTKSFDRDIKIEKYEEPKVDAPQMSEDYKKIGQDLKTFLAEQQAAALRSSQVEPEDLIEKPAITNWADILVMFTGAKSEQFIVAVPEAVIEGMYTPALGREIFSNNEVQAFFNSEVMLDGLPILKGLTLHCKVKSTKLSSEVLKMDTLSQVLSQKMGQFAQTPTSTLSSVYSQGFSMPRSPFDQIPELKSEPKED